MSSNHNIDVVISSSRLPNVLVTQSQRGPAGPTAVSTDPGNLVNLGTDQLIYVSRTITDSELTPIASYTETGTTLTFVPSSDSNIEIPLDGKVYELTITDNCNLVTGTKPTAPKCGSAVVYVLINTETLPTITTDTTWNWPDSASPDFPTANETRIELILNSTPQGWIVARMTEIGAPAT